MSGFLSVFGKIFVFCTFLPGLTGFVLVALLFPSQDLLEMNWYLLGGVVYGIGFVANAIGHFIEAFCLGANRDKAMGDFWKNTIDILGSGENKVDNVENHYSYAENVCIWYWNSATIISVVVLSRVLASWAYDHMEISGKWWTVIGLAGVVAFFLFCLCIRLRRWSRAAIQDYSQGINRANR